MSSSSADGPDSEENFHNSCFEDDDLSNWFGMHRRRTAAVASPVIQLTEMGPRLKQNDSLLSTFKAT